MVESQDIGNNTNNKYKLDENTSKNSTIFIGAATTESAGAQIQEENKKVGTA